MKQRIAFIGCGSMGQSHFEQLAPLLSRFDLVAAVDTVPERAEAVARMFPGAKAATNYHDILKDVDSVVLVLPHHLHHSVTMDCLAAGKHVFVEKPMANTEKDCCEMIAAARKAKRVLMVGYVMRYHPMVIRMKELIDQKTYGECFQVSIWTEQLTQFPRDHWASNPTLLGGGQFFSHGCHYVDLLLWFLGAPVRGVHVGTNLGTPWMEKEGTSNMIMEFEGGKMGYHMGTWGARGSRLKYSYHAHCTEGMIEANFEKGKLLFHKWGEEEKLLMDVPATKPLAAQLAHFLDCSETGKRPETDGARSLQSLRVIWRMYEAEQVNTMANLTGLGLDKAMTE